MGKVRKLEKLIQENRGFLQRYELALAADPENFGNKLMVTNIKRHLLSLENQLFDMIQTRGGSPSLGGESMVASSAY